MMADQVEKYNVNNILLLDNNFSIKQEECEESNSTDNKIEVSETVLIIGSSEMGNHDKMKQYKTSNDIKTEFLSCKTEDDNMANCNVKTEKQVIGDNIKMEFENGLYCEACCEVYYDDYCIKCGMLVHILNKNTTDDTIKGERLELPNNILEIQNSFGRFGIFALKVIPESVKFGPFTGFKSKNINWMKYINRAKSPFEGNLLAFQCENNLYYLSICEIQKGDELLVHFGEKYENSLSKDFEEDFILRSQHIIQAVFACTFCCLGFSSISNLVKHKTVCSNNFDGSFPNEELTQCSFCKIYLYQEEYVKHHMTSCFENNNRKCVQPPMGSHTTEVTERKTQRRRTYKCAQCKYRTKYKGDLRTHTNQHYEMKIHKCGICNRRFRTRNSLTLHKEISHVRVGIEDLERSTIAYVKEERPLSQYQMKLFKCSLCEFCTTHKRGIKGHINTKHLIKFDYKCEACDYKTNYKSSLGMHMKTQHLKQTNYKCEQCDYKTNHKAQFKMHIKTKHLVKFDYECEFCRYKTNNKSNFERHIKCNHLKEFDYKCDSCHYETNRKSIFEKHIKSKHLKKYDYKCETCDYKTNIRSHLAVHVKTKHHIEFDYNCRSCDYKTNYKSHLENHIKTNHLKEFDYKCESCRYETNRKAIFEKHIKSKHLKEFDYKCGFCDYKTNRKTDLEKHVKASHLKEVDYKCESCDYKTNYKSHLEMHVKTKHLVKFDYECVSCDYKTNYKSNLDVHVKTKHLKEFDYKCESCDYKTNIKSNFNKHVKASHLKELD